MGTCRNPAGFDSGPLVSGAGHISLGEQPPQAGSGLLVEGGLSDLFCCCSSVRPAVHLISKTHLSKCRIPSSRDHQVGSSARHRPVRRLRTQSPVQPRPALQPGRVTVPEKVSRNKRKGLQRGHRRPTGTSTGNPGKRRSGPHGARLQVCAGWVTAGPEGPGQHATKVPVLLPVRAQWVGFW